MACFYIYFQAFILCFCLNICLFGLSASSLFVKQPGDLALTATPGYPLEQSIPCLLENITYQEVGWEQKSRNQPVGLIALNREIYFNGTYAFISRNDPLDYSISMTTVRSDEPSLRCYVLDQNDEIKHSSWSNITYTGMHTWATCMV